ncbi:MAG: MOSC domain-containing protein [Labilithrix sp.]|nr:MOSC domain-containing protein [Labilithrix sp.]MCW5816329.1 MOSC domain-containing protein [Labilithrix sp.]
MSTPRVAALYIYPLKGARAIALERSDVLRGGLRHDRRFMALDAGGKFVTQREHPKMALVTTAIEGGELVLSLPSGTRAAVPLDAAGPRRTVKVWDDEVVAVDVGGAGAALLSDHLGQRCALVRMPPETIRQVDRDYAREGDRVGFADGYPVLVASLASLADLNARLATPVGIDRFRANVIVDGAEAWAEEGARVRIGDLALRTPKRCSRCQVITIDQTTAATSKEPLRTLATFRKEGNKVNFAMNAIPDAEGSIAIGDPVVFDSFDPLR